MDGIQCILHSWCKKANCRHERVMMKSSDISLSGFSSSLRGASQRLKLTALGVPWLDILLKFDFVCCYIYGSLTFYDTSVEDRKSLEVKSRSFLQSIRSPMRILIFVVVPYTSEMGFALICQK